jgi:hypothetical protein
MVEDSNDLPKPTLRNFHYRLVPTLSDRLPFPQILGPRYVQPHTELCLFTTSYLSFAPFARNVNEVVDDLTKGDGWLRLTGRAYPLGCIVSEMCLLRLGSL